MWYSAASVTSQQAAASFQWSWVHSPAHYLSMINPSWTYVGIGLYSDASGWYGTHEFRS